MSEILLNLDEYVNIIELQVPAVHFRDFMICEMTDRESRKEHCSNAETFNRKRTS